MQDIILSFHILLVMMYKFFTVYYHNKTWLFRNMKTYFHGVFVLDTVDTVAILWGLLFYFLAKTLTRVNRFSCLKYVGLPVFEVDLELCSGGCFCHCLFICYEKI